VDQFRRRQLVIAAGVLLSVPSVGIAQQPAKVWRVGFLSLRRIGPLDSDFFGEFARGMRELGYIEGRNLIIDWRSAEGKVERLPELVAELLRLKADVIVAAGAQAVGAAQKATARIPIVMGTAGDPVGSGFVKSLGRPGGNITGLSDVSSDVGPKLLDMLHGALPKVSHVAVLVNPDNSSHPTLLKSIQAAAQSAGIRITAMAVRTPQEIEIAVFKMPEINARAMIAAADALFNQQSRQIADLAARRRLPAISGFWQYVDAGGLMSYGHNFGGNFRRAAIYVDKIFKGANPADLPVEQPTKFELAINLKAARALGLNIPKSFLLRADRVIE